MSEKLSTNNSQLGAMRELEILRFSLAPERISFIPQCVNLFVGGHTPEIVGKLPYPRAAARKMPDPNL
jgi:hypothetical protein